MAQALEDRLEAAPGRRLTVGVRLRADLRQGPQPEEPRDEEEDVDRVGPRIPDAGDQHTCDARPDRHHHSHRNTHESGGLGDLVKRQEPWGDRLTRCRSDGRRHGVDGGDDVERPDRGHLGPRDEGEGQRGTPCDGGGGQRDQPPVEVVGDRATVEARDDHRHECEPGNERHHERRLGEVVDVQADRSGRHHRTDPREGVADPQPGEGRAHPQGGQVDQMRLP